MCILYLILKESEARSEILRQMARKRKHSLDDEENLSNIPGKTDKHLNLFQELESGVKFFYPIYCYDIVICICGAGIVSLNMLCF